MKLGQKGVVHLLMPIVLLLGLIAGVILVTSGSPLKLFSKASEIKTQSSVIGNLTNQLVQTNNSYKRFKSGDKLQNQRIQQQAVNSMVSIAARRKAELLKEIEKDAQAFLRDAKLASQRNNFPKEVQNYLENRVDNTEVTLTVIHFDDFKNAKSTEDYSIQKTKGGSSQKAFFTKPPKLLSGTVLRISGTELDNNIAIESNNSNLKPLNKVSPLQISTVNLAVILVKFDNDTTDFLSKDDAKKQIFDAPDSVAGYFKEASYGKVNMTGDVLGWYRIPSMRTSDMPCNRQVWDNEADQAASNAGVNLGNYTNILYLIPNVKSCSLGIRKIDGWGELSGNRSGSYSYDLNNRGKYIIIHELGHNFGLLHANSLSCNGSQIDSYQKCIETEYGDSYSIMGQSVFLSHFNAPYALALDWLQADNTVRINIDSDGIYKITTPLEKSGTGVKSLIIDKMLNATGEYDGQRYYLEYRQPLGFDSSISACASRGIQIRIWTGSIWRAGTSKLLNLTPSTPNNFTDASLADGGMFYDPINKILIKQLSHDSTSATVEIKFNASLPNGVTQNNINPQCSVASCELADLNRDGVVDSKDADVLQPCINKPPTDNCTVADIDQNGVIDIGDFSLLVGQQGKTCPGSTPIPTPTPSPFVCNTCNADIDKNGNIDITDFSLIAGCFEKQASEFDINGHSCANPDLNKDGIVNQADADCLKSKFGQQCKTITPTPTASTSVNNQTVNRNTRPSTLNPTVITPFRQ